MLPLSRAFRAAIGAQTARALSRVSASRNLSIWARSGEHQATTHALVAASLAAGALVCTLYQNHTLLDAPISADSERPPRDEQQIIRDTYVSHMNDLRAQATRGKVYTADGNVIRFHSIQHASNSPCEDEIAHEKLDSFDTQKWAYWAVFDGHAGGATSKLLKKTLITEVAKDLLKIGGDEDVDGSVRSTFKRIDDQIISRGLEVLKRNVEKGSTPSQSDKDILAQAWAGSCALLAMLDPSTSKLRIAVTGDSRAVLGRFSIANGAYEAVPMSIDQNGKNPQEKARLDANHPGEEKVINPRSGRVLGIAISRAFGDSRWKWSEDDSLLANEKVGGPRMRGLGPPGSVKTPPYLLAEPEIISTDVAMGGDERNADFLIMASDGFWDHISNEDAVTCVANWVAAHAASSRTQGSSPTKPITEPSDRRLLAPFGEDSPIRWPLKKGEGIWGDWKVKPEDFVYEEHNAATHLVQNAFGGRRRGLFCGAMAEKYPLSRWARDDISVYVIFFGKVGGKTVVDEPVLRVV